MRKIYRNQKPKKRTKAQRRREWEYTVIAGGMVRASALPRTAAVLNRGRGAIVRILGVPLLDNRQLHFLQGIADLGIIGQTAEEVAAFFILEGISRNQTSAMRISPPRSWEGWEP
jgi:hypothetical protein